MSKVTVIIPTHNRSDYLPLSVASVLGQTLDDFELIVVDDGSTDGTAAVVADVDDPRLRYVAMPRGGVSAARNAGLALAASEYVAFLDDDDLYHPEFLRRLVSFLDAERGVGLAYAARVEIDGDGRGMRFHLPPETVSVKDFVVGFPFALSDCIARRALVETVGGFDTSFVVNEDRVLFVRMAFKGCTFARVDGVLSSRRRHEGRSFADLEAKLDDMQRSLAVAFDDPRCPPSVRDRRLAALGGVLLEWTYQAARADARDLARAYLREAYALAPPPSDADLCHAFASAATRNGGDPEGELRSVCAVVLSERADWEALRDAMVADACLRRGACELIWNRCDTGRDFVARACGARPGERFHRFVRHQLGGCAAAFGPAEARAAAARLTTHLKPFGVSEDSL